MAELLRAGGVPARGFFTEELRERGERVGFAIETLDGRQAALAHVRFPGPPRVGRYGVDLAAFERLALPALRVIRDDDVLILDELGKMELACAPFRALVAELFERPLRIVATVHVSRDPLTDGLKRRSDVAVLRVTAGERDRLPELVLARLR